MLCGKKSEGGVWSRQPFPFQTREAQAFPPIPSELCGAGTLTRDQSLAAATMDYPKAEAVGNSVQL